MHVLIFGDSITQGYDDYQVGGWANRLFTDISARVDKENKDYISVFNLGIDGDSTREILARLENEIKPRLSDEMVFIFDMGGNDSARRGEGGGNYVPFEEFSNNYQKCITTAREYGQVLCLGLHESNEVLTDEDYNKYNSEIERLAEDNNVTFISMKGILSEDFENLTYDGDHPSPEGHRLIYERVRDTLKEGKII
tara:strand:+ start:846 stop:1433 length:588 start_codon:yes stop_codon:yes gene_type:complete